MRVALLCFVVYLINSILPYVAMIQPVSKLPIKVVTTDEVKAGKQLVSRGALLVVLP